MAEFQSGARAGKENGEGIGKRGSGGVEEDGKEDEDGVERALGGWKRGRGVESADGDGDGDADEGLGSLLRAMARRGDWVEGVGAGGGVYALVGWVVIGCFLFVGLG